MSTLIGFFGIHTFPSDLELAAPISPEPNSSPAFRVLITQARTPAAARS
jgi:hypothetical protein